MTKPLTAYRRGNRLKIVQFDGGRTAVLSLIQMGLNVGDIIVIKRKSLFKGPITIELNGSEIALGHGLSEKILVVKSQI